MSSDRTDFRLPGHCLHPLAERKCLLSIFAAHSRRWNPQNLEHPWYEPWGNILAALVAEHPSFSVQYQPNLWYIDSPTSQPHTTPGPDFLRCTEDEESDELTEEVGNDTLDSIHSISVPSHNNRSQVPDLAIARKDSFPRPGDASHFSHLSPRVTYVGYPLLAELKAAGARSDDIRTSFLNARFPMLYARSQLYRQASHLFSMYPHQQSVILVAITGLWWSYRNLTRDVLGDEPAVARVVTDVYTEEEPDSSFPDQDGIHSQLPQGPSTVDADMEAAEALQSQLRDYGSIVRDIGEPPADIRFHTVLPESQLQLVTGDWSRFLLYGTAPSNQILSLILDHLRDVV